MDSTISTIDNKSLNIKKQNKPINSLKTINKVNNKKLIEKNNNESLIETKDNKQTAPPLKETYTTPPLKETYTTPPLKESKDILWKDQSKIIDLDDHYNFNNKDKDFDNFVSNKYIKQSEIKNRSLMPLNEKDSDLIMQKKEKEINAFSESHTIEEEIYLLLTFLYVFSRTITLFKKSNNSFIAKLGQIFIQISLFGRFLINLFMLTLVKSFPKGKEIIEEKYFLNTKNFLNFFNYKIDLTLLINCIRLLSDTIFISSMFLFSSKYFTITSSINGQKKNNYLKKMFIFYSLIRIPLTLFLFIIYSPLKTLISTTFILEIIFLCLFLFTQSIKLSVSRIYSTKTVYSSIILLFIFGILRFGRFFNLELEHNSFFNFIIYKSSFFLFLFLVCYLTEMFLKRSKSDFYEYFDDENLTISTSNKGIQYYVNQLDI